MDVHNGMQEILQLKIIALCTFFVATVHFPRIGFNTPNFNWYGAERLIKKLFISKGVAASVYLFIFNYTLS